MKIKKLWKYTEIEISISELQYFDGPINKVEINGHYIRAFLHNIFGKKPHFTIKEENKEETQPNA